MQKWTIILALLLWSAVGAFSQDRSITILNFANETGDDSGATMAATTQGIVTSGVRYIGTFKIVPTPSFKIGTDTTSLKEYADLTNSEYVIFGKLAAGKGGTVKIENGLYCHADDSIFKAEETAENALDVFSASDAISIKILSELYKTKIAYGTLTIKLTGPREKFDVYVNDVLAASNTTSISSIPDGEKQVRVIARSGRNDGKVLFNDKVVIRPNAATPVAVSFEDLVARVTGKTDRGLLTLTSDPPGMFVVVDDDGGWIPTPLSIELAPGTHKIEPRQAFIDNRFYETPQTQWVTIMAGAEAIIPLKLTPLMGRMDATVIPAGMECMLDDKKFEPDRENPTEIQAGVYNLEVRKDGKLALYERVKINSNETFVIPWGRLPASAFEVGERAIAFKAKSDSWDEIKPVYLTDNPKWFIENEYGITSIKIARDKKYFYWHVEFNGKNPIKSLPAKSGGNVDLLLQINNVSVGTDMHIDLNVAWNNGIGLSPHDGEGWADQNITPVKVSADNSITGRVEIATLRRYFSGPHKLSVSLGDKDWKYSTYQEIGWVDFGFLAKK
jgi:hypothetical protein